MTFSSIAAQTYLSGKTSSTLLRPTLITNCAQRLFLSVSLSAIIDGKMSWFFYCLQHFWDNFVSWKKDHFEYSLVWIIFTIDFHGIGYSTFCFKICVVTCVILARSWFLNFHWLVSLFAWTQFRNQILLNKKQDQIFWTFYDTQRVSKYDGECGAYVRIFKHCRS